MAGKVTDPALLAALEGKPAGPAVKVADPALIAQLEAPPMMASHGSPTPVGKGESGVLGAMQGGSLGFGDEIAGAVSATLPDALRMEEDRKAVAPGLSDLVRGSTGDSWRDRYQRARDYYREKNATAQTANPGPYLTGQIVGGVATGKGLPVKGAAGVLSSAGQGALAGAGYSDADSATGIVGDSALGGGLGLLGHAAGRLLGGAASKVGGWASRVAGKGAARASEDAAEAATKPVTSLEAAARERAANAYRQAERVNLLLADPALPAEERAALEAFKKSQAYAELIAANARGSLSQAPEALAEREAARQIASEARAALPSEIASKTKELLAPQIGKDTRSFLKSYAEPLAWTIGAQQAANALGFDPSTQAIIAGAAGIVGGRTRAGKALYNRVTRPANQFAVGNAVNRAASAAEPMLRGAAGTVVPGVVAGQVMSGEPSEADLLRAWLASKMSGEGAAQ